MEGARVAVWILMCLHASQSDLWDGLGDRDASFLSTALAIASGLEPNSKHQPRPKVVDWVEGVGKSYLRILTPMRWESYSHPGGTSKIADHLPDPGPDWTLIVEDENTRGLRPLLAAQRRLGLVPRPKKK